MGSRSLGASTPFLDTVPRHRPSASQTFPMWLRIHRSHVSAGSLQRLSRVYRTHGGNLVAARPLVVCLPYSPYPRQEKSNIRLYPQILSTTISTGLSTALSTESEAC
jgi:hypothetical protein